MEHEIRLQKAARATRHLGKSHVTALLRLYEVDLHESYKTIQFTNLTTYLETKLAIPSSLAAVFVTVIRKCRAIPQLLAALAGRRVSLYQAKTIASVITTENAPKWIALCACCTHRELEWKVAQERPAIVPVEKVRFKAKDQVMVTVTLPDAGYGAVERGQQLLKQSSQAHVGLSETVERVFRYYVEHEDPVLKAERKPAEKRSEREKVLVRDQGACQFQLSETHRCGQRYWIDIHHIRPRALGGADCAENLITLCSAHHRMQHSTAYTTR